MKIIHVGSSYKIYTDDLKVYDELPVGVYNVDFNPMSGFSLSEHPAIEINERVYGVHEVKAEKVMRSFTAFERNLGVILSGSKGIGKSLFAKLLCLKAMAQGLPVIIVDSFTPGIARYLGSIEQRALVLFDEFDKTFGNIRAGENEADPQAGLLSLFDGITPGKKLFVITCNELRNVNDYLVNRPGRFHYHFRFDFPSADEIREYMNDNLKPEYVGQIEEVVKFAGRVGLNYDCLRSIAFELNTGEQFKDAIGDLNIVSTSNEHYDITLHMSDGTTLTRRNYYIDLFSDDEIEVPLYDKDGSNIVDVTFFTENCVYDYVTGATVVPGEAVSFSYDDESDEAKRIKAMQINCVTIKRHAEKGIHYAV